MSCDADFAEPAAFTTRILSDRFQAHGTPITADLIQFTGRGSSRVSSRFTRRGSSRIVFRLTGRGLPRISFSSRDAAPRGSRPGSRDADPLGSFSAHGTRITADLVQFTGRASSRIVFRLTGRRLPRISFSSRDADPRGSRPGSRDADPLGSFSAHGTPITADLVQFTGRGSSRVSSRFTGRRSSRIVFRLTERRLPWISFSSRDADHLAFTEDSRKAVSAGSLRPSSHCLRDANATGWGSQPPAFTSGTASRYIGYRVSAFQPKLRRSTSRKPGGPRQSAPPSPGMGSAAIRVP